MANSKAHRVFVLELHRDVEEMSSAEIISHLMVKYAGLLIYVRKGVGDEIADKAERGYKAMISELAERFCIPQEEILEHAAATMALINNKDGGGNVTS